MKKRLRCYLGLHRWQRLKSDGGGWYMKCRDCGKYDEIPESFPGAGGAGF